MTIGLSLSMYSFAPYPLSLFDCAVLVDPDAAPFQFVDEVVDRRMVVIAGDHHRFDGDPPFPEIVDNQERVGVIGDAEVRADLFAFDVAGIDADHHVDLLFQALEKLELHVRIESRENPCRVKVVCEFPAEFQIEFVVETASPFQNLFGLLLKIQCIVETSFHHSLPRINKFIESSGSLRCSGEERGSCGCGAFPEQVRSAQRGRIGFSPPRDPSSCTAFPPPVQYGNHGGIMYLRNGKKQVPEQKNPTFPIRKSQHSPSPSSEKS